MQLNLDQYHDPKMGKDFSRSLQRLKSLTSLNSSFQDETGFGVSGSTFRAYTGYSAKPSLVFRKWARKQFHTILTTSSPSRFTSQNQFDNWHKGLSRSLQQHWATQQKRSLSFAQLHKLIDLFIKWLSTLDFGKPLFTESLVKFANCALDSKTLSKLNQCYSMALPIRSPSMGDIHSEVTYKFCQNLIRSFTKKYGGTALLFDFYGWGD
jgi:hypothetical protein